MIAFFDTTTGRLGVRTVRYPREEALTFPTGRHSTSSRKPGKNTGGEHQLVLSRLQLCPKCKEPRYGSGPHSPRWLDLGGSQVQVDCQLEDVRR